MRCQNIRIAEDLDELSVTLISVPDGKERGTHDTANAAETVDADLGDHVGVLRWVGDSCW